MNLLGPILQLMRGLQRDRYVPAWLPSGNGLFISRLHQLEDLRRMVEVGRLSWVCILREWQNPDGSSTHFNQGAKALAAVDTLRELGVQVTAWSYPEPDRHAALLDRLAETVHTWGARALVIDPEAPYHRQATAAIELDAAARETCDALGVSYGVTSYGAPFWHETFPFREFGGADFAIPQVYTYRPGGYVAKCLRGWRDHGHDVLVGGFGTYAKTRPTADRLRANLREQREQCVAVIGWKAETTDLGELAIIGEAPR